MTRKLRRDRLTWSGAFRKKDKTETYAQEMSEEEFKKWAKKDDDKKQDASKENYEDIDETPKLKKMKISDP